MSFAFVLLLIINGDPLPWAGFHTMDDCVRVLSSMRFSPGVSGVCGRSAALVGP